MKKLIFAGVIETENGEAPPAEFIEAEFSAVAEGARLYATAWAAQSAREPVAVDLLV